MSLSDVDNDEIKTKIDALTVKINSMNDFLGRLAKIKQDLEEIYQKTDRIQQEDGTDLDVTMNVIDRSTNKPMSDTRRSMLRDQHIITVEVLLNMHE